MASGRLGKIEFQLLTFHQKISGAVLGSQPYSRIIHHQWIMDSILLKFARQQLEKIPTNSSILDVGCGSGPYWELRPDLKWIGLDIYPTTHTHYVVDANGSFPIQNASFDYVLCTQVLEHAEEPQITIEEIGRVLKDDGYCMINMPFIYPFHGTPHDYRRWTTFELIKACNGYEIVEVGTIGGIGASLITLWLNFCEYKLMSSTAGKIIKVLFAPLFWIQNVFFNIVGLIIDRLDSTESFPTNTYIVFKKVPAQT